MHVYIGSSLQVSGMHILTTVQLTLMTAKQTSKRTCPAWTYVHNGHYYHHPAHCCCRHRRRNKTCRTVVLQIQTPIHDHKIVGKQQHLTAIMKDPERPLGVATYLDWRRTCVQQYYTWNGFHCCPSNTVGPGLALPANMAGVPISQTRIIPWRRRAINRWKGSQGTSVVPGHCDRPRIRVELTGR